MSPDFSQDFTLYTFASNRSYAVVLTQKNVENNEVPIAFMRLLSKVLNLTSQRLIGKPTLFSKQLSISGPIF
jgi:hypothetical protein